MRSAARLAKGQRDMRNKYNRLLAGRRKHEWVIKQRVMYCRRCGHRPGGGETLRDNRHCKETN